MYDSLKRTCTSGITSANIHIKQNEERDYFLGVRNAYSIILRQLLRNEKFINEKGGLKL